MSGFFSKLYLIIATVNQKYFVLVGSLIIGSTVSCMYYLKVIRNIMSIENKKKNHLLVPVSAEGSYIIIGSLILHLIFIISNKKKRLLGRILVDVGKRIYTNLTSSLDGRGCA